MAFESSDAQSSPHLRPLRVPQLRGGLFRTAKELISDLPGWKLVSEDEAAGVLVAERAARFLGGRARVTVRVEGEEGIPSTTVRVASESRGGLLNHDKANVVEFMKLFSRRVV